MSNFRREHSRKPRQAVDGILNAPSRPQLTGRPLVRHGPGDDSFHTTPRTIGDFKRSQGYHAANSPVASPRRGQAMQAKETAAQEVSLLHMTLPSGNKFGRKYGKEERAKKRNWRRIRKLSVRGGLAFLAILLLLGGFLFAKGYIKLHKVFKGGGSAAALNSNVSPALLKGEGDGRVNILLMGRGGEGHDGADLTDTILVASIDPVNNKAALVSVPRDLWVKTPGGSMSKINATFAEAKSRARNKDNDKKKAEEAGIKAVQETVKSVLGVPLHYYAMVDFQAFKQAVDTVGGVDFEVTEQTSVTERLWDMTTRKQYYLDVKPGMQHFDGQRALFYARSRHTSPRGDFDRAERQRVFIQALVQKVASAQTYTNPVKISQLMDTFGDHVATDMNLNDAVRLMTIGKAIGNSFDSVDFADSAKPMMKTGTISGQSVVIPAAGVGDYSQIQALVRSKLKDGYIVRENANVTVLNGTVTPGLAGQKAEELKTYGYNVGTVTDAPTQTYEKTVIVDLTNGSKPYTKNYLEKRYGVTATATIPDQTIQPGIANFVIILGKNETINR